MRMIPDKLKDMSTLEIAQLADKHDVEVIDLLNGVDRKRVSIDQHSVIESYRKGDISRGRLFDLSKRLNISALELLDIAEGNNNED